MDYINEINSMTFALDGKKNALEDLSKFLFLNNFNIKSSIRLYKIDYYISDYKVLDGHVLENTMDGDFKIEGYNIVNSFFEDNFKEKGIIEKESIENEVINAFRKIESYDDLHSFTNSISDRFRKIISANYSKDLRKSLLVSGNSCTDNNSLVIMIQDFTEFKEKFELYNDTEIFRECIKYLSEEYISVFREDSYEQLRNKKHLAFKEVSARLLTSKISRFGVDSSKAFTIIDKFSQIASLNYEKAESNGEILFASIEDVNLIVEFRVPIKIDQAKYIRKMLETSLSGLYLIFNIDKIIGLGTINKGDNIEYVTANFIKKNMWQIKSKTSNSRDEEILFDVENTRPKRHRSLIKKDVFLKILRNKFKENVEVNVLYNFITEGTKQIHGTIIVIQSISKIKLEIERLGWRGIPITHDKLLNSKLINAITSIDGAVFVDTKGFCHAIGVILDGTVPLTISDDLELNNPERGSRYNSALLYQYNNSKDTICIVISEDGYINIIDN